MGLEARCVQLMFSSSQLNAQRRFLNACVCSPIDLHIHQIPTQQVRIEVYLECPPLPLDTFKPLIRENMLANTEKFQVGFVRC